MTQVETTDLDETKDQFQGPSDEITEDGRPNLKNTDIDTVVTEDDKIGINKSSLGSFGGN